MRGLMAGTIATGVLLGSAVSAAAQDGCTTNPCRFAEATTQTYVVPAGVTTLRVLMAGGRGATGILRTETDVGERYAACVARGACSLATGPGGRGALLRADLPVVPGQKLVVEVAGDGVSGGAGGGGTGPTGLGGNGAGGGGGASTLRPSGVPVVEGADPRLLVAGGGGGGGGVAVTEPFDQVRPAYRGGDAGQPGQPLESAVIGQFFADLPVGGGAGTATAGGRQPNPSPFVTEGHGTFARGGLVPVLLGGGGGGGRYGGGAAGLTRPSLPFHYGGGGGGSSMAVPPAKVVSLGTHDTDPFVEIAYDQPAPTPTPDKTTYELLLDGVVVGRATGIRTQRPPSGLDPATAGFLDTRRLELRDVTAVGPRLRELARASAAVRRRTVLPEAILLLRNAARPTGATCLIGLHGPAGQGPTSTGFRSFFFRYERQQDCSGNLPDVPGITAEVLAGPRQTILRVACLRPTRCRGRVRALGRGVGAERSFDLAGQREVQFRIGTGPKVAVRWRRARVTVIEQRRAPRRAGTISPGSAPAPPPVAARLSSAVMIGVIATVQIVGGAVAIASPNDDVEPPPTTTTTTPATTPTPPPAPPAPEPPAATTLSLGCSPAAKTATPATYSGKLTPGASNVPVTVTFTAPGRTTETRSTTTGTDGAYAVTFAAPASATWTAQATSTATSTRAAATSPACSTAFSAEATTLTLQCPDGGPVAGPIPVSGKLTPGFAGAQISVRYRSTIGNPQRDVTQVVTTAADGTWSDSLQGQIGYPQYEITATFAGDASHQPSSAPACTVTVN